MLRPKHFLVVLLSTFVVPFTIAYLTLASYNEEIDEDFKEQVALQKMWLGNECPIDVGDASEILQYKHFVHESTISGLTGVCLGQLAEWNFLSNKGRIN